MFESSKVGCPKCGVTGSALSGSVSLCRLCDEHHYEKARSLGVYEKALSASVLYLKRVPTLPQILSERIADAVGRLELKGCDVIMPVPLSLKRRIERGFNQADVIAESVAKVLSMPVDSKTLIRTFHTPMHRAAMDKKAREMTVKNAFAVQRPRLTESRTVLLVDDIFTSGATASSCAKALIKAGAKSVNVFTLARAN